MTEPSISVIIPVYNGEPYLAEALDSVLGQSRRPSQVLVIDDGSHDGSANLARRSGVELLRQENLGASAARNRGIEAATGDFLAFLDADDYWPLPKLEIQARALAEDPGLDMVFGQARHFFSPELDETERSKLQCPEEPMAGYVPGTLLIRRSTLLQVGLFNPELRVGEFIEWFDRARAMGLNSRVLPETLLFRRIHRDNLGRREKDRRQDYLKVVKAALDRRRKTVQG